eukprot:7078892-Prymnesium_polylepis.1
MPSGVSKSGGGPSHHERCTNETPIGTRTHTPVDRTHYSPATELRGPSDGVMMTWRGHDTSRAAWTRHVTCSHDTLAVSDTDNAQR